MAEQIDVSARLDSAADRAEQAADILHAVANGGPGAEVPTNNGLVPSVAKWLADHEAAFTAQAEAVLGPVTEQAGIAVGAAEAASTDAGRAETAAEAAIATGKVYADTASGLAATASGQYFSVPSAESAEYLILYKNDGGVAAEVKRSPSSAVSSLLLNAGKEYPLKPTTRDGATSAASAVVNASLLDIKVIGARAGKFYRLEWIGTGATVNGSVRYEMLFTEYDKATYGAASATGMVEAIKLGDIPATSIEAGTVITRVFSSTRITGLHFIVTYKPGALPAASQVIMNTSGYAGYSWIIDEACYMPAYNVPQTLIDQIKTDTRALAVADVKLIGTPNLNETAHYPLKSMSRDSSTSAASAVVNASLLDIKVIGARAGKLYRLEWIGTGVVLSGTPRYEMLFTEYDKATYGATSATGMVEAITLGDIPATSIEAGTVITRVFSSTRITGLHFIVTYKPGALPAGSQVIMSTSGYAGYSWIIDEACYMPAYNVPQTLIDQIKTDTRALAVADVKLIGTPNLNETAHYPLKSMSRDSSTSAANAVVNASLLDIKVIGARAGKLYRLEWIGTGATVNGSVRYEMLFTEYDKATYGAASATGMVEAIKLGDIPATSIEAGTVITRVFSSTRITGLHFIVTYKPGALPAASQVIMNTSGYAGYSWIIDEACYVPASTLPQPAQAVSEATILAKLARPLAYSITSGSLSVVFRLSDTHDLRVKIERFGINSLYNFNNIAVATHGGTPPSVDRTWTVVSSNGTDWIGPYHVLAVANGDGGAQAFTGGTHGSNGDTTGNATASHQAVEFVVDGRVVSGDAAGLASEIVVTWRNRVQGYNTKSTAREVLEETITVRFTSGCAEVQAEIKALEDISIRRYYGLQTHAGGFKDSVHMVKGQQGERFTPVAATDYNSGNFSAYPDIPAIALRGPYGDFWMVLDYSYGFGAERAMDAGAPSAQFSQYSKAYFALAYSASGKSLAASAALQWRGFYAWGKNLSGGGLCDAALRFVDGEDTVYRAILAGAGGAEVLVPSPDRNRAATYVAGTGDARTGARATQISSASYGVVEFKL